MLYGVHKTVARLIKCNVVIHIFEIWRQTKRRYFVSRANDELYKSGCNQGINPITSAYVVEMWNTIPNACLK